MRIAIAGPIADRRHFDREVAPLLADDARYVGHLTHDELPGFLRRGSVFVSSPRWPEPFGLALVEAMACGTPAAALPRGAAHEVVVGRRGCAGVRQQRIGAWPTRFAGRPGSTARPSGPACSASTTAPWSARTSSC